MAPSPLLRTSPEELSASVQEIMGRAPGWLLRSGMSVMAGASFLLLVLTALIRYPDTISGRITVTGTNPPVAVVARQSGHLERLNVVEKQEVQKDAVLAVIRSPVDSEQALALKSALLAAIPALQEPTDRVVFHLPHNPVLGSVQAPYTEFAAAWAAHDQLASDSYAEQTEKVLRTQLLRKKEQISQMEKQVQNIEREHEIARVRYDRLQQLQKRDSISVADLQEAERALLEQDRQQSAVRGLYAEAQIAAGDYEKQIETLIHNRNEELRKSLQNVAGCSQKLLAAIDLWEADYVLRAPVAGAVGFYDFWSGEQYVTAGKEVFIIAPKTSPLVGRVPVQALGAGKIGPGQKVSIHFDDFPYKEFGIAMGEVESVSLVAQKGAHLVSVRLPSPLTTNYGRPISFKQEMTGDASIIVEDRSLLGRIFSELRDAFVNRTAR